jgi:16S rRNA (guanine1207-N2)-methyltransferase
VEAVSQVILRNEARLPPGPVLLIDPARDSAADALRTAKAAEPPVAARDLRLSTQDFGDFRWFEAGGAVVEFAAVPTLSAAEQAVILRLPREKDRLAMQLHAVAAQMQATGMPSARLWLVGENRAGIKSAGRHLQQYFGQVAALDKARHCGLFEACGPRSERPFKLEDYVRGWSVRYAGRAIHLRTLPGVFAHGRLDRGTALLLAALERRQPRGRVLDFACGSGVVGLALQAAAAGELQLTLLDASALALESSRRSLAASGLDPAAVTLLASDGLAELSPAAADRFDWIVSNPPFHRGVRNDLDVAAAFFRTAGTFLRETGRMVVVFNRHLPYPQWLQGAFGHVERLVESGEYTVVEASRPTRSVTRKMARNVQSGAP